MVSLAVSFCSTTTSSRLTTIHPQYNHRYRSQRLSFNHLSHHHNTLRIRATNADDNETPSFLNNRLTHPSTNLKIAIVGFGNFGQFLAKAFIQQGHVVIAHSRSNCHSIAQSIGANFFSDLHDLCEQHPDVIVISTSIISTERVIESLPMQRLRRSTLFVDVLSVKEMPRSILLRVLPTHFDILCTHPMFGPESGKNGWKDLPFMFDKVRVGNEECRVDRVESFLDIFKKEGCKMEEMSCAEHDKQAAGTQFMTHVIGRILQKLELESTPINTRGYDTLLDLVQNTSGDSFDLFYGLFMYNPNSMEQLERLYLAFEAVRKLLFAKLHETLRKQLFRKLDEVMMMPEKGLTPPLSSPGAPEKNDTSENLIN